MISLETDLQEADQICLPDRYQKPFVEAFQTLTGQEVPNFTGEKLDVSSGGKLFRLMRGRDIPNIVRKISRVEPRQKTVGLTGSEWVLDYMLGVQGAPEVAAVNASSEIIGAVGLLTLKAGEGANDAQIGDKSSIKVVTAYRNLVPRLGRNDGLNIVPSVVVSGKVEGVARLLNMAAVDLVVTGASIKANGFEMRTRLLDVYPAIVRATSPAEVKAWEQYQLINGNRC